MAWAPPFWKRDPVQVTLFLGKEQVPLTTITFTHSFILWDMEHQTLLRFNIALGCHMFSDSLCQLDNVMGSRWSCLCTWLEISMPKKKTIFSCSFSCGGPGHVYPTSWDLSDKWLGLHAAAAAVLIHSVWPPEFTLSFYSHLCGCPRDIVLWKFSWS